MADTAVAITAGAGTNIDTRTESTNSNHRQVVVIGDPATNAGVAPVDVTNGLSVNVTNAALTVSPHAVTNAGTFVTQENGAALTSLQLLDDTITAQGTALGTTKTTLLGGSVTTAAPTYTTGQISPLNLDTTGSLRVNVTAGGAGGGIVTQATAANLNSTAQITDGTNIATVKAVSTAPVTATDKALVTVLRPDSAGVITTGTAGTPSSQVITVQGVTSMTPMSVSNTPLTNFGAGEYETVAASQTAQVLGATGATGDFIQGLLVVPATTSPGNVLLLDNATSITVFTGGATSVSNLVPFFIPLGMISVSGAWKVTTGANVSVIGIGNFT